MGFELLTIGLGVLIVYITKGSFKQLVEIKLQWWLLAIAGLVFRIIAQYAPIPEAQYDTTGFYILMFSFILLLAFCLRNILKPGFAMVTLGVFSNFLVSVLNRGMPVDVSGGRIVESSVHQNATNSDILGILGDIFSFDLFSFLGIRQVISIGDIMLGIGIIMVMYFNSRVAKASSDVELADESPMITPNTGIVSPMQAQLASFGVGSATAAGAASVETDNFSAGMLSESSTLGAGVEHLEDNFLDSNKKEAKKEAKKDNKKKKKKLSRKEKKAMKAAGLIGADGENVSTPGVGYLDDTVVSNPLEVNPVEVNPIANQATSIGGAAGLSGTGLGGAAGISNSKSEQNETSFVEDFVNSSSTDPQTTTFDQPNVANNSSGTNIQGGENVQYDIPAGYPNQDSANMSDSDLRSSFDVPFGMQENQVDQTFVDKDQYLSEADQIDAIDVNEEVSSLGSSDSSNVLMGHMQMPAAPAFGLNEETDFEVPIDNVPINNDPFAVNTPNPPNTSMPSVDQSADFLPPQEQFSETLEDTTLNSETDNVQSNLQTNSTNFEDMFSQQLPPVAESQPLSDTNDNQNEEDFWGKKDESLGIDDFYSQSVNQSPPPPQPSTQQPEPPQQVEQTPTSPLASPLPSHPEPTFQPDFDTDNISEQTIEPTFETLSSVGPEQQVPTSQANVQQPTFSQGMSFQPPVPQFGEVQTQQNVAGADQPGVDQPGLDQPGVDQPGLDQPGLDQPDLNQSDDGDQDVVPLWRPKIN